MAESEDLNILRVYLGRSVHFMGKTVGISKNDYKKKIERGVDWAEANYDKSLSYNSVEGVMKVDFER